MAKKERKEKRTTNEKPISLYPLSTEEAIKKLLQAPAPKKKKPKRGA
ncbi:MAG: hypothetical protein L0Y80_13340 [Ignavibacteriae bacterium]|nr:hypothetical protein [Ignavibacteriota bacterium]